jgi:hypothetical protein
MGLVEAVLHKGFNACTHQEIDAAYRDHFGFPPCKSCTGTKKYRDAYDALYKSIYKLKKIIPMKPTPDQKYYWNPEKSKLIVHVNVNGRAAAYSGNCTDQRVLEKIYNNPRRAGIVLINPDFKKSNDDESKDSKEVLSTEQIGDKAVTPVVETVTEDPIKKEADLVKSLHVAGKNIDEIKAETGISKTKIKAYLKTNG